MAAASSAERRDNRAQDFSGAILVIRPFIVPCTIRSRDAIKAGNEHV
jgi:hypothetical protein